MNFNFLFGEFLGKLKRNLPALIVLVLCATMTLAQWRRHPRAAVRAAIAFCWFLLLDLAAIFWYTIGFFLVLAEIPHPREVESFGETTLSCMEALGYVFFVVALSAAREPYRPPEFYDDPRDFEERLKAIQDGSFTSEEPKRPEENQKTSQP